MLPRERWLAMTVGSLAGLWLLDVVVIEPAVQAYRAVVREGQQAAQRVAEAQVLIDRAPRIRAAWAGVHAAGLGDDEDHARFQLQQTVSTAARHAGITLESAGGGQRIPASHGSAYDTLRVALTAQGSLAEVLAFLGELEQASMPLSLERCEIGARDGHKDHIDLAVTVSTRLVTAKERATHRGAEGATPWHPPADDAAARAAVVASQPFLAERRHDAAPAAAPAAAAAVGGTWGVVGVVTRADGAVAFLRHTGDGREMPCAAGDALPGAAGTVAAITVAGLAVRDATGSARTVAVGQDLAGQPLAVTTAGPAANPLSTAAPPDAGNGGNHDAILQRLRKQRNRSK